MANRLLFANHLQIFCKEIPTPSHPNLILQILCVFANIIISRIFFLFTNMIQGIHEYVINIWNIHGQTFCDLQTLLHTFFGFPGAFRKVTFIIFWMEGWTFVGI